VISSFFLWCEIVDINLCSGIFSVITHYFVASKCHFVHVEVDDVIQDCFCLVFFGRYFVDFIEVLIGYKSVTCDVVLIINK
jgi:hypothetical protein